MAKAVSKVTVARVAKTLRWGEVQIATRLLWDAGIRADDWLNATRDDCLGLRTDHINNITNCLLDVERAGWLHDNYGKPTLINEVPLVY